MANDPEIRVNQEWIGYVQPVGLVVSPPALGAAQAFPNKHIIPDHTRFLDCVDEVAIPGRDEPVPAITDFPKFCSHVLGWRPKDLVGTPEGGPLPEVLEVVLPEYHETLRPTYALREDEPGSDGELPWMMLIQSLPLAMKLDVVPETEDHRWQASPQSRFERLLRESQVPIGLLFNGTQIRIVYAPRGETSGHATFNVKDMSEVAGRPIFAALHMLLCEERLFTLGPKVRLPAILSDSRKYQNLVSTQLAEQVLAALYELVRGFQSADDQRKGDLLREVLAEDPNHVYAGLLTVLMRLVFVLYAEDRDLLSSDEVYQKYYAVTGLFERLREDAGRHTDTMDHRYGAWAQLLTLFRLIHDGGRHGDMKLLARKGYLFDPDRYPFLEGRAKGSKRQPGERTEPPHVSDGVVFRVLHNLLILGGERLSYRTLDVEQIGSVYETMMGFNLEVAQGRSIAIKPKKAHGAPTSINLDELLEQKSGERAKWLKQKTDQEFTGQAATALKEAETPEDAVAALEKKVAKAATPRIVPPGAMVLQPSDERRKSGSHYTPRSLTEPIVRTTFRPILERLGESPKPDQILDLKVCDPAMGSGAFLVEACRQLGDELVKAWHAHECVPKIPADEDELLHARRIVAQRCLYGVDKNPMAVDLAKLSLWLATLAKEHPFTFVDHALRHGDSLVGLSKKQIEAFHWKPERQRDFSRAIIADRISRATSYRCEIRGAAEMTPESLLSQKLALADEALNPLRFYGDLVIAAFFAAENDRQRKGKLDELAELLSAYLHNSHKLDLRKPLEEARRKLLQGEKPVDPFHWEIEFPEVFEREHPGFDAFVSNPPFLGGLRVSELLGMPYFAFLITAYPPAGHMCDLAAYFLRKMNELLREDGTMGCITTNTIAQGDTREGGLQTIKESGSDIYFTVKRFVWPGAASVIATILCISKTRLSPDYIRILDGKAVSQISSYLFHGGSNCAPEKLVGNPYFSAGCNIAGMGFVFDDTDDKALSTSIMRQILETDSRYQHRIMPYIGGAELNASPTQSATRYAYNLSDVKDESELDNWSALADLARRHVKPDRERLGSNPNNVPLKRRWWAYQAHRPELYDLLFKMQRVLAIARVSQTCAFTFVPTQQIFSERVVLLAVESYQAFAVLQSRTHESWARFLNATLKDDMRYAASDCFENYPFPAGTAFFDGVKSTSELESVGGEYYRHRSELMLCNDQGLTKTYNRFHDPVERSPDILKLRELHAAMDMAVLEAYGWRDLAETATCEFLLDYEEDEADEESTGGRRRKKPWRYRWPDDFRDEVLARLLELNRQRAEEERLSGLAADGSGKKKGKGGKKPAKANPNQPGLFG